MIEIKKPGAAGTQLITTTLDLIDLGVDFTQLQTNPYKLINGVVGKIIVPIVINNSYYSIGTQSNGFYIISEGISYNTVNALYNWLSTGVVADQSGLITFENFGTAQFSTGNNAVSKGLMLYTDTDQANINYTTFKLTITYFLINSI